MTIWDYQPLASAPDVAVVYLRRDHDHEEVVCTCRTVRAEQICLNMNSMATLQGKRFVEES
jgi:hypothetical protein